ncbi:MAG TPA: hypothetical protein VMZ71_04665 [Gemmataceae bacterium]|nr:hypothetical protein [Gemmataceae bacterium]
MTTETRSPVPPTMSRELSDAELEAVAAGKMRGVAESRTDNARDPLTGAARTTSTSSVQRFRGLRPGIG